jgi:methyltransferase-like protein
MFVQNYAEGVREPLLKECGGSQVVMEQYLDFLVNRTFRQTLLVKAERAGRIRYQLDPQRIGSMHYAGTYAARDGNALVLDSTEQPCTASFGRVVTLRHPVHKAVALTLSAQFPAASSLDEIIVGVLSHLDEPESVVRPLVLAMIEELLIVGAVHVRSVKPEVASRVSALPRALEGNRRAFESFAHGERPTATCNQWHEQVALSPLETFLMPLLDGTRSLETLEAEVTAATRADQLRFARDGKPMEWRDVPSGFVRDETMLALQGLQRKGLLVA